jgi:hypothetical protein
LGAFSCLLAQLLAASLSIAAGGGHTVARGSNGTMVFWDVSNQGKTDVVGGLCNVAAIDPGSIYSAQLKSSNQ